MNYFSKVTGSAISLAKQSMQVISLGIAGNEESAIREVPAVENPHRILESNFRSALEQIESIACLAESKSFDGDRRLQQSKVKHNLKTIVEILEEESNNWNKRGTAHPFDGDGSPGTPCMDTFLQSRMVQELCNRAVLDNPRGCLPLVLNILALLLRSVSYPLLPHMTVHKPLANLISVAVRYDAMHMYTNAANSSTAQSGSGDVSVTELEVFNKAEYAQYKRRIEVGLVALLRVLWRKFSENPATLDYFTFEDRRKRADSASHSPVGRLNSSTGTPTTALAIQTQMDVLNAVVNMLHQPHVALYAQEALLVALNMCDRRIDRFVQHHTRLVEDIVSDLCRRFQAALAAANDALTQPTALYCGSAGSANSSLSSLGAGAGRASASIAAAQTSPLPPAQSSFSTSNGSLLSPLGKIPSFSLGSTSAAKPSFYSPTASAALAYAREALYGGGAAAANTNANAAAPQGQSANQSEPRSTPMQNFLRALRFSVAVAAALRRMAALSDRNNNSSSSAQYSTYNDFTRCFVESFLQDTLGAALHSRGEGSAVAVSLVLRSMLEEMYAAEQLWAVHSGVSTTYSASYSATSSSSSSGGGARTRSLLYFTTQFLCGSLPSTLGPNSPAAPVVNEALFGTPKPVKSTSTDRLHAPISPVRSSGGGGAGRCEALQQVNHTAVMLARVGSITRLISVSSYLALCSVLQSAPLSLALQVLLRQSDSAVPSPVKPSPVREVAQMKYTNVDDALVSICTTLSVVASNTLADDLAPSVTGGVVSKPSSVSSTVGETSTPSRRASTGSVPPTSASKVGPSSVQRQTELAAQTILSRLPGKALWSLLSCDPEQSALSPVLLTELRDHAAQEVRGGALEVLGRRLASFLSMKFDEQVALSALLQRTVCLLSVVVLACPYEENRSQDECDPALFYLLQIADILKVVDKLWKEILGYLPRIPSGVHKVPAMRSVLLAAAQTEIENSIYLSIANEGGGASTSEPGSAQSSPHVSAAGPSGYNSLHQQQDGRVSITQRVDAASWKLVEKESAQARSILESAVLLHEIRAEVRAYLLALRSLRAMIKDTVGATVASRLSGRYGAALSAADGQARSLFEGEDACDVPAEREEDEQGALLVRHAMHLCGWAVPPHRGTPFDPRAAAQLSAQLGGSSLAMPSLGNSPSRSLAGTRDTTPSASAANLLGLGTPGSASVVQHFSRRALLFSNLDLREQEFLAEFQALERSLEEIVDTEPVCGG